MLSVKERAGKNLDKVEGSVLRAELERLILSAHLLTALDISSQKECGDYKNQRSLLFIFLTLKVQVLPRGWRTGSPED